MGSKRHSSSETTKELSHKKSQKKLKLTRVKNVKNVTSDQTNRLSRWSDQTVEKNNVTEKRVTESHRKYILECGEDITSVSRARKGS